jgi:hypothetical protein
MSHLEAFVTKEEVESVETELFQKIIAIIQGYVTIIVAFIGVFGNLLSLVVFFRVRKRRDAAVQYLGCLAVTDTFSVLFIGFIIWVNIGLGYITGGKVRFDLTTYSLAWCKILGYAVYSAINMSGFLIATYSLERAIVVCFPLKRKIITNSHRRNVILVVIGVGLTTSLYRPITFGVLDFGGRRKCTFNVAVTTELFLRQVDRLLYFYGPVAVIIVANIAILVGVSQSNKALKLTGKKRDSLQTRLIVNTMLVSLSYIALLTPAVSVGAYLTTLRNSNSTSNIQLFIFLSNLCSLFSFSNYSFNFVIYSCTLPFYRAEVKNMFCFERKPSDIST